MENRESENMSLSELGRSEDVQMPVEANSSDDFYNLPADPRQRSRKWSVLSLLMSVLSVLLCSFYYVSLPMAFVGIGLALISRRTLGFFDGIALSGIIIGISGAVFGVFSMILNLSGLSAVLFG